MAVPKIAVIALVAIIAVPILLGYALNLTETTESDFKITGDEVNVTPLLLNGKAYTYSHGDIYQLNTKFKLNSTKIMAHYENTSFTKSSLNMQVINWPTGVHGVINQKFGNFSYFYYQNDATSNSGNLDMEIWDAGGSILFTINRVHTAYYDGNNTLYYTFYTYSGDFSRITNGSSNIADQNQKVYFRDSGGYNGTAFFEYAYSNGSISDYADLSSGYYFSGYTNEWILQLPNNSRSALITIDLDSITDSNYSIRIGYLVHIDLVKTTDGLGNVTWTIINVNDPTDYRELYYDPSGRNVYQMKMDMDLIGTVSSDPTKNEYQLTYDLRYIGSWPTVIGEANYYSDYTISRLTAVPKGTDVSMPYISMFTQDKVSVDRTPTIRVDDALFRAFQYDVIEDQTYSPSSFKTNPSTKISSVQMFGKSIEFGGNTYNVSGDGNITVGSHQIPVNNLVLSSVPNENGGYDNKIGNTVISTTAQPSTIKFNGQWNASIATNAQESYTYTKTEWNAGSFGWDGIDQNFLMVGLITCLGVFVALGIYARKKGSGGIIPLMIAVGCASMVFFIML